MSDRNALSGLLKERVDLYKKGILQKLVSAPWPFISSKIIDWIPARWDKNFKIRTKAFWGEDMLVVIPEVLSLDIYRFGFVDEIVTTLLLKYLKPASTFFDIGAHFGYFTLLACHIIGKQGYVHCFEPAPGAFAILQENVSAKQNVVLNNYAVFSRRQSVCLKDYGVKYSAFNSIYGPPSEKNCISKLRPSHREIQTISIDEYVKDGGASPDFIKIDAEGSEFAILLGMEEVITRCRPLLLLEVGDMGVEGVRGSRELVNFIIDKGYRAYECRGDSVIRHHLKQRYQYDNMLFLPI